MAYILPATYEWMDAEEITFRTAAERNFLTAARQAGYVSLGHYEAMQTGHTSVVYAFENAGKRLICKLARKDIFFADAAFYTACAVQGIPTLSIHKTLHVHEGLHACFMNFVDAPVLADIPEQKILKDGMFFQIGASAARVHQVTGEGFGPLQKGRGMVGESENFPALLQEKLFRPGAETILEGFVTETDKRRVHDAMAYLNTYFQEGNAPSICHGDLNISNVFETNPVKIFDPGPVQLSHPMLDLGLAIVYVSASPLFTEIREQLVGGYKSITSIDEKALAAAIVVSAYGKLPTIIRKQHERKTAAYLSLLR